MVIYKPRNGRELLMARRRERPSRVDIECVGGPLDGKKFYELVYGDEPPCGEVRVFDGAAYMPKETRNGILYLEYAGPWRE